MSEGRDRGGEISEREAIGRVTKRVSVNVEDAEDRVKWKSRTRATDPYS